jgi:hypothetical protein
VYLRNIWKSRRTSSQKIVVVVKVFQDSRGVEERRKSGAG